MSNIRTFFLGLGVTLSLFSVALGQTSKDVKPDKQAQAVNAAKLVSARKESVQEKAQGPFKSIHLSLQTQIKGKAHSYFYSIQSYRNPGGDAAYVMVLTEQIGKTSKVHTAGAASGFYLDEEVGEFLEPADARVHQAFNAYLKEHKAESLLKP